MYRLTVNLTDDLFEKLKIQADNKCLSLSHYGNALIEIGLMVEEAAADSQSNSNRQISPQEQKFLWKTMLTWELESRYLLRHLVDNLIQSHAERRRELLEESKQHAEAHVNKLFE